MSLLSNLQPTKGSKKNRKRVGRGDASGTGGTAGKGHKGQTARSGGSIRRGFEGGQTPLTRRIPKFGFSNVMFETRYEIVNLDQLNKFSGDVDTKVLVKSGLVSSINSLVKILGRGTLSSKVNLRVHKISQSARKSILDAGGTVDIVEQ